MNILKEVLKHEVFPALGCTEPIAVAYAASLAARELAAAPTQIEIRVDPAVYKNGFAVAIPNSGGAKGNLIAGVLGALVKAPELKMEVLRNVSGEILHRAEALIHDGRAHISYDKSRKGLFIAVRVQAAGESAEAVIQGTHTNLVRLEKNGRILHEKAEAPDSPGGEGYKPVLKAMTIAGFIDLVDAMDAEDYRYIRQGIKMNLEISEAGRDLKKVGYYLSDLMRKGYLLDDVFSSSKILTASAADARMAGLNYPVMASGGSGNQGVVAILVPYNVGRHFKIEEKRIIRSIALSHLVNSYIKCFTGELSPLCGCAIAAGVGAAVAIVYQQHGKDLEKITLAVNNLISDLGGMLCDGAKGGCALKVASSADSAIRSAYMAMNDHGITATDGFVGRTAEETIRHLSKISREGMAKVDDTMLAIMTDKIR